MSSQLCKHRGHVKLDEYGVLIYCTPCRFVMAETKGQKRSHNYCKSQLEIMTAMHDNWLERSEDIVVKVTTKHFLETHTVMDDSKSLVIIENWM